MRKSQKKIKEEKRRKVLDRRSGAEKLHKNNEFRGEKTAEFVIFYIEIMDILEPAN